MMTEYIDREAVKEAIGFIRLHHIEYAENKSLLDAINEIPAADVAPVKRGRWELYENDDDLAASFFCSLCGWNIDEDEYLDRWSHFNYCPNCGAKMDGGNGNG